MDQFPFFRAVFKEHETFLKFYHEPPRRDKGWLFLDLDIADNPGAEDAFSEKLWRALQSGFYNSEADDPYYSFEEALKKGNEVIEQESLKRTSGHLGRVHALVGLLQGNTLHFSHMGSSSVYLKRGNHCSLMSEEMTPDLENNFRSISSGELHHDDILLFSTRPLPLPEDMLLQIFSQKPARSAQQLKTLLKSKDMVGQVSFFTFEAPEKASAEDQNAPIPLREEAAPPLLHHPRRKKIREIMEKMKFAFPHEHYVRAKKTLRTIAERAAQKLFILAKKPSQFQYVNRRYLLLSVIVLMVVFGILVSLQSGVREKREQAKYYEDLLEKVKNNISIAENRFLIGEKTDASTFLNTAETALQEIKISNYFQSDVEKYTKEIGLYRDNFDAILRVESPILFANLSEKTSVDAIGIIHTKDEKNYIYEPRRLFETILDKVQEGLSIDTEEIVLAGAELEDFNMLSFLTQSGQIIEYSMRNGKFERMKTQDETWKKAVDIQTFNGEFIYLLDPSSNTIWKYRRLRNGYSKASVYTTEGDLSNAISMAIDGDIFVLLRNGTILKYRKGKLLPYDIKDQPSVPVENPSHIFTLPESTNVYVLDSSHMRIVAYSKGQTGNASYQKQIVFQPLKPNEIRDFYVDRDEQKLVILTSGSIFLTDF